MDVLRDVLIGVSAGLISCIIFQFGLWGYHRIVQRWKHRKLEHDRTSQAIEDQHSSPDSDQKPQAD